MVKEISKLTKYLTKILSEEDSDFEVSINDFLDNLVANDLCKAAGLMNYSKTKFFHSQNSSAFELELENNDLESYEVNNWGHLFIQKSQITNSQNYWFDLCDSLALFFLSAEIKIRTSLISKLTSELRKTLKPEIALDRVYAGLKEYAGIEDFYFFTKHVNVDNSSEPILKSYSIFYHNNQKQCLDEDFGRERVLVLEEIEDSLTKKHNLNSKIFKVKISALSREWGIIAVSIRSEWTTELEEVFEIFAEQMATVFNQYELHNESLTMAQREFLLNQITTRIRESLAVPNIIETSVQEIAQVMSTESCGLIILDRKIASYSNHKTWSVAEIYDQSMNEALYAILKTNSEPSWQDPTISIGDIDATLDTDLARLRDIGTKSLMITGLFKDDSKELVGILAIACFTKIRNWTYDEQLLLEGAAKQIEIALVQASIYQESQQTKRQMSLLHKLSNDIRDSLDISVVMGQIARGIGEVLGLSRCFVRRLSANNEILQTEEEYSHGSYIKSSDLIFSFEREWINQLIQSEPGDKSTEPLSIPSIKLKSANMGSALAKITTAISLKSYLAIPLIARGHLLGTINIHQCDRERLFLPEEIEFVFRVASEAAIALEHASLFETINKFNKTDPDTGLYNKRYFREIAESEIKKAKLSSKNISFMLVDVDHLKEINDDSEYGGHEAGDEAINILARVLSNTVRQTPIDEINKRISDIVGRFGGDEFMVLLPNTHISDAVKVAERIASNLAKAQHSTWPKPLTCSIGVAGTPHDYYDYESFKTQADKALYLSKAKGRNAISATVEL